MKRFFVALLVLIAASANAQNIKLYLKMSFKDEESGDKIPLVNITVKDMEKDVLVKQLHSDANGNITKVTVPINMLYWIQVEKEGWCTKTFYLDTRHSSPEDLPKVIDFILDEQLFKVDNAKTYEFMTEEPMREFLFTETGGFTWKKKEGIRADKKVKLVHLNHLSSKDADKFLDYMEEGEKLEKEGKNEEALKIYNKALAILPIREVEEAVKRVGG